MTPPELRSEIRQSLSLIGLTALMLLIFTLLGLLATSIGS
jgi:hypothetical protein